MLTSTLLLSGAPFLKGMHVLLALSGGADSVALFYLLKELEKENALTLSCAHFEHGIRKSTSERDMLFVRALCEKENVPLYIERANVPEEAALSKEGLETCARRLRYDFLYRVKHALGADAIALAHHKDDNAETVLMHLLRGGGISGACGMKKQEGVLIRPLLDINKSALIDFLDSHGYAYTEDETNFENNNPRNLIRNVAFPALEQAYPGAKNALLRFSEIARAENAFMEHEVKNFLSESVAYYAGVLVVSLCPAPDIANLRRALKRLFPAFSFEDVERAVNALSKCALPSGITAERIGERLYLSPSLKAPDSVPVSGEGEYALSGVCRMTAEASKPEIVRNDPFTQVVSSEAVKNTCLRLRNDNDYMCPLGMKGKRKLLSDILTDKKIPRPIRDRMPVLARGNEILWAAGAGISESIRIENQTDAVRLKMYINTENGGNTNEK